MQTKYEPLAEFLGSIPIETIDVILAFDRIAEILCFPLPASAHKYQAWWSYEKNPKQPQKQCWQEIGWRVEYVDIANRQVRFCRNDSSSVTHNKGIAQEASQKVSFLSNQPSEPIDSEYDFSLSIQNAAWNPVFVIPKGSILLKGRHGLYHDITLAAAGIKDRFGCYSWGRGSEIYYCGSFAQDYVRGGFKSNLQARVHNYLQNHRIKATGQKNTNLMVFEKINETLLKDDVVLSVFTFRLLKFAGVSYSFSQYCEDPDLVHLVEQLLISFYRKLEQCHWNRT